MPRRVWWTKWDDYEESASIVHQERVSLDMERAAHRYLSFIERTVVGFYWEL
jgi:hypothetical protein